MQLRLKIYPPPTNTGAVSSTPVSSSPSDKSNAGTKNKEVATVKPIAKTTPKTSIRRPMVKSGFNKTPDFMKNTKPKTGLGSGKSLMGW